MFSPSQTKLFARCRYKWFLSKVLGTDYAYIGKRDLAACVGVAVGAAVQSYYLSNRTLSVTQLVEQAKSRYEHEVAERCAGTRQVADCEEAVTYPGLLEPMVKAFLKKQPVPAEWTVDACENPVSDDYHAYLDMAGQCPRGPWIADVKCKMSEKIGYMQNSLLKYQFDSQLLQYVREWSKKVGQKVQFYRIIYIVGSPVAACQYQDFEVDWSYLDLREQSDVALWQEMAAANLQLKYYATRYGGYSRIPLEKVMSVTPMSPEHMDGFYKCDMWEPCLVYAGDASASPNYIQVERNDR